MDQLYLINKHNGRSLKYAKIGRTKSHLNLPKYDFHQKIQLKPLSIIYRHMKRILQQGEDIKSGIR